jgi:hypothetical protein
MTWMLRRVSDMRAQLVEYVSWPGHLPPISRSDSRAVSESQLYQGSYHLLPFSFHAYTVGSNWAVLNLGNPSNQTIDGY